jgi:ABC-type amino acid transport system permease subunit
MQFLQKIVVLGFKLYTPIAIAEYAHRSLKSKATGFFLTFVGVLAWPVGWSLVNAVTFGIFKSLPAPQNQNFATLMIAIVLAVPVLLWVLIGHVMAPIFVQKVVIRGGSVIQGFAGTVFSAVGASSMAIYSSGLTRSANGFRNIKENHGQDVAEARSAGYSRKQREGDYILGPFDGSGIARGEADALGGTPYSPESQWWKGAAMGVGSNTGR